VKRNTVGKQTIAYVKFSAVATVVFLYLSIKHPSGYSIGLLVFFVILFVVESWAVFRLRRETQRSWIRSSSVRSDHPWYLAGQLYGL
jgi:hypothetical protein